VVLAHNKENRQTIKKLCHQHPPPVNHYIRHRPYHCRPPPPPPPHLSPQPPPVQEEGDEMRIKPRSRRQRGQRGGDRTEEEGAAAPRREGKTCMTNLGVEVVRSWRGRAGEGHLVRRRHQAGRTAGFRAHLARSGPIPHGSAVGRSGSPPEGGVGRRGSVAAAGRRGAPVEGEGVDAVDPSPPLGC
jgi:hypothetical protein